MKYFFIHKSKDTGEINALGFKNYIATEEDLNKCINEGNLKDYLKIPSFKKGDTVKIISKEETDLHFIQEKYAGKEFVFDRMEESGLLRFTEAVENFIYIVDLQTI